MNVLDKYTLKIQIKTIYCKEYEKKKIAKSFKIIILFI